MSVNSKADHPPREFFERANAPPQAQRNCETPTPEAGELCLNSTRGAFILKNPAKKKQNTMRQKS